MSRDLHVLRFSLKGRLYHLSRLELSAVREVPACAMKRHSPPWLRPIRTKFVAMSCLISHSHGEVVIQISVGSCK